MTWFRGKRKHGIFAVLLVTALLTGCTWHSRAVDAITDNGEQGQVGDDPALGLSIDVPESVPNILVDQNGYRTGAAKMVIFRGKELPQQFEIRRVKDNAVVFTGSIKDRKYNDELKEYDSYGYFTDFQTDGEYYIHADLIGSSYAFTISDDVYQNVFNTACKQFYLNRCGMALTEAYAGENAHSVCHFSMAHLQGGGQEIDVTGGWHLDEKADRDVLTGCSVIDNLLLAYEMNPDSFSDDTGIPESNNKVPDILDEVRYEIEWMCKMQASSGGVYAAAMTEASDSVNLSLAPVTVLPVSPKATIAFSGAMARFAFLYQKYDSAYAASCLQAAEHAWEYYTAKEKANDHSAAFAAAAQLYRETGDKKYEKVLSFFFNKDTFIEDFQNDDEVFAGGITYLLTNQRVNVEICSSIMKELLEKTEKIADGADRSAYFVYSDQSRDVGSILADMCCLTVTNHVIYSHEYTEIIENYAHYLMGRNQDAVNLVDDTTEHTWKDIGNRNGITMQPIEDAEFIILISTIGG